MYQQLLEIGRGQAPAVIEYTSEDGYCIVQHIWMQKRGDVMGMFDQDMTDVFDDDVIDSIGERLDIGHDNVVREMNLQARADRAADNAAFREVYA